MNAMTQLANSGGINALREWEREAKISILKRCIGPFPFFLFLSSSLLLSLPDSGFHGDGFPAKGSYGERQGEGANVS